MGTPGASHDAQTSLATSQAQPSAAHTPGPWFAGPVQPEEDTGAPGGVSVGPFDLAEEWGARPDYTPAVFNDHYEDQIALVSGCNHNAAANARLIAAAPETYEALKAIQRFCDDPAGDEGESLALGLARLLVPARAAIAKAEGRSQDGTTARLDPLREEPNAFPPQHSNPLREGE